MQEEATEGEKEEATEGEKEEATEGEKEEATEGEKEGNKVRKEERENKVIKNTGGD